jgi:hypothetical protein
MQDGIDFPALFSVRLDVEGVLRVNWCVADMDRLSGAFSAQ